MDVLILHYHLNPGGVTRIIQSQVQCIKKSGKPLPVKVLCGVSENMPNLGTTEIIQDGLLNYIADDTSEEKHKQDLEKIIRLIRSHLTGNTIIHSHNPSLGKNPVLTVALFRLASEGIPVVNHYHDFADDRPVNMNVLKRVIPLLTAETPDQVINPDLPGYFYIVLSSCDRQRLIDNGVGPDHIRFLPNPVSEVHKKPDQKSGLREKICARLGFGSSAILCTYPVRAIERKNIGEFILIAVLFAKRANFAITMAPLNPVEIKGYERWRSFCRENSINVKFEAGETVNFEELIAVSDFCITTSVREGFGMIYMEPWLAGTPVIGREISCVISDLEKSGMKFPRLYKSLHVRIGNKTEDFKDLTREQQESLIIGAIKNNTIKEEIKGLNRFLESWLDPIPAGIILNNQKIIRQKFSLEKYGKQLLGIYTEVSR